MKNFTITTITLLSTIAFAGAALAGDPKTAPPPAPDAKKVPDAAKKAPDTAAKKAPESKPVAKPPEAAKPEAPPAQPDPAPEVLAALKTSKGTWRCKGEMFDNPDGSGRMTKFTIKVNADLDKFWIKSDFAEAKAKGTKYPFKFTAYKTYSAADSKWHQVMVDNWGTTSFGWSTGPDAAGKTVWEMEMTMAGQTVKFRDYEEPVAGKKRTTHSWGEMSENGKEWKKVYDATCSK